MNKIKQLTNSTIGRILVVLILLAIGFFGGMEYKAYQLRKALADAFSGFTTNTEVAKEKPVSNDLNKKITLQILNKTFSDKDYVSELSFNFQITNNTEKDIEGIQGTLKIKDLFGNTIKDTRLSYDKGINACESKLYPATLDYNQFMESDIKLRQTELEKMNYTFDVDTIVYKDGTKENI